MKRVAILLSTSLLFAGCGKDKDSTHADYTPKLTTSAATNITSTSATLGGVINDAGSSAVVEYGVCWGTSHNPDLQSYSIVAAGSRSPFSFPVINLSPATTYYVRAYAKNNILTGFGAEVSFTTP